MYLKLCLKIVPENNANSKITARKNAKVWLILSRLKVCLKLHLKIVPENNANFKIAARKNAKVWLILSRLNAILSQRAAVADAIRRL